MKMLFRFNRDEIMDVEKRMDAAHLRIATWMDAKEDEMNMLEKKVDEQAKEMSAMKVRLAAAEQLIRLMHRPGPGELDIFALPAYVLIREVKGTRDSPLSVVSSAPSEIEMPAEDTEVIEVDMPADEELPAEVEVPVDEEVPGQAVVPADVEVPADMEVPVDGDVQAGVEVPAEVELPAEVGLLAEVGLPAQIEVPARARLPADNGDQVDVGLRVEVPLLATVDVPAAVDLLAEVSQPAEASQPAEMSQPAKVIQPAEVSVPADVTMLAVQDKDSLPAQTSDMPPPPPPTSSQSMPSVQLLPPTPNTSQEAADYTPTTLLDVPAPILPGSLPSTSPTRSPSPASELRRSPRLASALPGTSHKRQASESLVEPAAKKKKE